MTLSAKLARILMTSLAAAASVLAVAGHSHGPKTWSIKADYIEACSCSAFCSCYFNPEPEGGMMCEFNNAVKIAVGHAADRIIAFRRVERLARLSSRHGIPEISQFSVARPRLGAATKKTSGSRTDCCTTGLPAILRKSSFME